MLMEHEQFRPGQAAGVGDIAAFDAVAASADPRHAFLRHAWFAGEAEERLDTLVLRGADGAALAAIPRVRRRLGPVRIAEIAGCYWPFRSFPISAGASDEALADMLAGRALGRFLGPVWRMGPVLADDPTMVRIGAAARAAGWTLLTRSTGTSFAFDFAGLRAQGPWPRASALSRNRQYWRKLASLGEIEVRDRTGHDWSAADRDAMARIERESWFSGAGDTAAPKFADPARRRVWEAAALDPVIAEAMFCSLLFVGGEPAAFTFGIEAGGVRHCMANSYSQHFARYSVGRVLLYRDFERAADRGVAQVNWGCGDLGYKTEMGASAGPDLLDLLFVRRKPLVPVLRRLWT